MYVLQIFFDKLPGIRNVSEVLNAHIGHMFRSLAVCNDARIVI